MKNFLTGFDCGGSSSHFAEIYTVQTQLDSVLCRSSKGFQSRPRKRQTVFLLKFSAYSSLIRSIDTGHGATLSYNCIARFQTFLG